MSDVFLLSSYYYWSCLPLYFCIIDHIILTSLPPQMLCSSVSHVTELLFMFQSRLLDSDLQLLQTELMEASLTDTSGLSFFEHFHISPIKVKKRTASLSLSLLPFSAPSQSVTVFIFYVSARQSVSVFMFYVSAPSQSVSRLQRCWLGSGGCSHSVSQPAAKKYWSNTDWRWWPYLQVSYL